MSKLVKCGFEGIVEITAQNRTMLVFRWIVEYNILFEYCEIDKLISRIHIAFKFSFPNIIEDR
jgi:hypothetical protein